MRILPVNVYKELKNFNLRRHDVIKVANVMLCELYCVYRSGANCANEHHHYKKYDPSSGRGMRDQLRSNHR